MNAPLLEIQHLALDYGSRRVLEGVNCSVQSGEIVAILGASGTGKSSLLRVLAGLRAASAGSVHVSGSLLRAAHPSVALAFQEPRLLPWLNVEKNVAFGLNFERQPGCTRQEQKQRVEEALAVVELSHAAQYRPEQLSGGMAQRVALARCLARRPRVLLLDEPFGALDEITRGAMQRSLLKLVRTLGTAVVLVTHDIDEAVFVADRILLLGGKPASIQKTWSIKLNHPREQAADALERERLEIVQCLRDTFEFQPRIDSSHPAYN